MRLIKKGETIYYPPAWKWQGLILISIIAFLGIIALVTSDAGLSKGNIPGLLICIAVSSLGILLGWYKQNKKAFSIRLNAFGMMVTNYSNKIWYPWRTVNEIKTQTKDMSTQIIFKSGTQRNAGLVDQFFGFGHTKLPKLYDISHDAMTTQMYSFAHQYKRMELYKYPQLEVEAMKGPPPPTINVLWGRPEAQSKSKIKAQQQ